MKRSQPRLLLWLIILISLTGVFHGCAAKSGTAGKQSGALVPITRIEPREIGRQDRDRDRGSRTVPAVHFLPGYRTSQAGRRYLRCRYCQLQDKITVGKGAVIDIVPSQRDNSARLEIGLSQAVDTKVYPSQGKLIVEIAKPVEEGKSSPKRSPPRQRCRALHRPARGNSRQPKKPRTKPAPEKTEAAKPEKGTATIVSAVKATAGKDGVKVSIAANGTIVPNTFMVDGKRLVIDIPGAKSKVRPSVIPGAQGRHRQGSGRSAWQRRTGKSAWCSTSLSP